MSCNSLTNKKNKNEKTTHDLHKIGLSMRDGSLNTQKEEYKKVTLLALNPVARKHKADYLTLTWIFHFECLRLFVHL